MKSKRRRHDVSFKAKVALEALNESKMIQQITKELEIHPVQVSDWKKTMQEGVAEVFEQGGASARSSRRSSAIRLFNWSS